MSKTIYFYEPRGGVCIADNLHGHVPHRGSDLTEKEKLSAEIYGTPQVCKKCRCLFQPEGWNEYEEHEDDT